MSCMSVKTTQHVYSIWPRKSAIPLADGYLDHGQEDHEGEESSPFPAPKRGKARALRKPASILKKPASSTKIPYVRHGDPTTKTRNVRARWGISVQMLLKKKTLSLIKLLQKDGILPKMKTCPHCGEKSLTSLQYSDIKGIYAYRCNRKAWFSPIAFHPIFVQGSGNSITSLAIQAAILFCAIIGLTTVQTHLLLDANKKIISTIYSNLETARTRYVHLKAKDIVYGKWRGCRGRRSGPREGCCERARQRKLVHKMGAMGWFGGTRTPLIFAVVSPQSSTYRSACTRPRTDQEAGLETYRGEILGREGGGLTHRWCSILQIEASGCRTL